MKKFIILTLIITTTFILASCITGCEKKKKNNTNSLKNETNDKNTPNDTSKEYVDVSIFDDYISIAFYIEADIPFKIGNKMNTIDIRAYMNGYNWRAFLHHYLKKNNPDILEDLESDPEAGMYAAYYDYSKKNEEKANKYKEIIIHLVENENEIYDFLRKEANNINWD